MADSEVATYGSVFWERLNGLFSRSTKTGLDGQEQPERQGFAISMCILFSVVLWLFSSLSEIHTKSFEIETAIENLSDDEAFVSLPPEEVTVIVKGEGLQLLQMYYNPPLLAIDANESQLSVQGAIENRLPQNVSVERTFPVVLTLQKESRASKKVPIVPQAEISWPATHDIIQDIAVSPDSVEVSGAPSILASINDWPTTFLERKEVKDSLNVSVPLVDTLAGLVTLNVNATQLTAVTTQFTEGTRELDVDLKDIPSMHDALTLDPPTIEVRFRVPLSQYQLAQTASDFLASVSYDALRDDTTGYIAPKLVLPEGVRLRDVVIIPEKLRYYDVLLDE